MAADAQARRSVMEALEQSRADIEAGDGIEDIAPHMERWQRMVDDALAAVAEKKPDAA